MKARTTRLISQLIALVASVAMLQIVMGAPARADTCSSPQPNYQYCSGLHHEVLASKFYQGTSQWTPRSQGADTANLYVNGALRDKSADGECAYLRVVAVGPYWPASNPNVYTQPDWKVCGAGTEKIIGIFLDQAWSFPNTNIKIQHCFASSGQRACSTFFERTFPG